MELVVVVVVLVGWQAMTAEVDKGFTYSVKRLIMTMRRRLLLLMTTTAVVVAMGTGLVMSLAA